MYGLKLGGFKFLKKCERCGYSGIERDIKKCPSTFAVWKKTDICSNCYKEIKEELKNGKIEYATVNKNVIRNEIENDIDDRIQCPYCGSWVEKNASICEHCRFDFKTKKVSKKPRNYESSFQEGKDFSKIGIEKFDKKYLNALAEKEKGDNQKKFDLKPVLFMISILVLAVFLTFQFGLINSLTTGNVLSDTRFIGEWNLASMTGPAADNIDQYWSFFENNSLKVETKSKSGTNIYSSDVQWLNWDVSGNELHVSFDYSNSNAEDFFNLAPIYKYSFINSDKKLSLVFIYKQLNIELEMIFNKI
jgi:hypothetical protein